MAHAKSKRERRQKKVLKLDELKQINLNAAGLDIGAEEIWVCVPAGRDEANVRVFGTFTTDLHALADWLEKCEIDTVAMESTGVYWIPVYEILEERGFELYLVNARHLKNVEGRKSDLLDCQWVQTLHTYGLLKASFRPEQEIAQLQAYIRHRDNLIRARSMHIQHMQKALQLMNLRLTTVLSDITGQTGLQIIRAIVAGEHDPVTLARYRHPGCKSSQTDIARALTGHYRPEHLFMLQQSLELYDFYNHQLQACDAEIEKLYQQLAAQTDFTELPECPQRRSKASKNEPDFDLRTYLYQLSGVDLVQIDGIEALTAQTILSEIGPDVSRWPTVKHFASWLGLAPQKNQSGGRERPAKTAKNKNRVAEALRMAAQSLSRSQSALGAFYRRVRAKHGGPAAVVATAHKLARMVYFMLKYRQDYVDPGQDYYEQQYRERVLKNLNRKAKALGMELVPAQPVVS
jgi:transposase